MENLVALSKASVFLTGHTGFKGGWLALWLAELGADVHGYALAPPTNPSFFEEARVGGALANDTRGDLADLQSLTDALIRSRAAVVFHLAAQPLVRDGFRDPLRTLATNVIGTAHVLEAVRSVSSVRAVVVVATDKVYDNPEAGRPFSEDDPLGGSDPYSASKAAAEIVVASHRASYFGPGGHPARLASARAGNVIGGGDWATDRLVPDCIRAFGRGDPVELRSPRAVRPWQHVLDPLAGYLLLAERLLGADGDQWSRAWNFGPNAADEATAGDVARRLATLWGDDASVTESVADGWHEARLLRLDSTRARTELGWQPRWGLDDTLRRTVDWYRAWMDRQDMYAASCEQIRAYTRMVVP